MVYTYSYRILMIVALGLAAFSIYLLTRVTPEQELAASIKPSAVLVSMGSIKSQVKTPFEFTLMNVGLRPLRIAGTPSVCTRQGCVWVVEPPSEIGPNQTVTLHYLCNAEPIGPVQLDTVVYLEAERGVGFTIPVAFQGTVEDSGVTKDAL